MLWRLARFAAGYLSMSEEEEESSSFLPHCEMAPWLYYTMRRLVDLT